MNTTCTLGLPRLDAPGASSFASQPQHDEFSHLHFDRSTRSWWGHPDDDLREIHPVPLVMVHTDAGSR